MNSNPNVNADFEEYYRLVGNRSTETPVDKERRIELFLELQTRYMIGNDFDDRVTFRVKEGAWKYYGYGLYSEGGWLLYIGITQDPRIRWTQHLKDKHVSSMTVLCGGDINFVSDWEKKAIEKNLPPLNKILFEHGKRLMWWDMWEEVALKYRDVEAPSLPNDGPPRPRRPQNSLE